MEALQSSSQPPGHQFQGCQPSESDAPNQNLRPKHLWYVTTKGISSTKVCPTLSNQALFRLCSSRRSTPRLPASRRTSPSLLRTRTTRLSCMATSLHLTFFVTASLTPNRSSLLRSPGRIPDSFFCRPQSLIGQGSKFLGQGKRTSVRLQQCYRRVSDDRQCRHF